MKGSLICFDVSGTAEALTDKEVSGFDKDACKKVVKSVYDAFSSETRFLMNIVKNGSTQLNIFSKDQASTIQLLNDVHMGLLLSKLNTKLSDITYTLGIDVGSFESISLNKLDPFELLDFRRRQNFNNLQIIKKQENQEPTSEGQQSRSIKEEEAEEPHCSSQSPPVKRRRHSDTSVSPQHTSTAETLNMQPVFHIDNNAINDAPISIDALGSKMKKDLLQGAKERSGFHQTPVSMKEKYKPVNLELVRNLTHSTTIHSESELYSKTKLTEIYTTPAEDNVSTENLFLEAQQNAEHDANLSNTPNPGFKDKHANIVGVVGQAGIGKTTFLKNYIQDVLGGLLPFQVSFLFLIFARELDFSNTCTLLQFLLHSILPGWEHSEASDKALIKMIKSDPNVFIAIDGLDEVPDHQKQTHSKVSLFMKSKPWNFLTNIIDGNLLTNAKKLVTSRPSAIYCLPPPTRPHSLFRIWGLSKASQKFLGKQICGEKYTHLKGMVQENPDLCLYWYIPIYCILALVHFCKIKSDQPVVVAFTAILSSTFVDFASSTHLRGKEVELEQLTEFAYYQLKRKNYIFEKKLLKSSNLSENTISAFFKTSVLNEDFRMTILEGQQKSYFSHLIWQEFFAAVYAFSTLPLKDFKELFERQRSTSEMLLKFLCGFCNKEVCQKLREVVISSTAMWIKKKNYIKFFLQTNILNSCQTNNLQNLFFFCNLLKEANDQSILSDVVSKMPNELLSITFSGSILPGDIAGLCYLLKGFQEKNIQTSIKIIKLHYDPPKFHEGSLHRLLQEISYGIKVQEFEMSGYPMKIEVWKELASALHNLEQLKLNKCGLTHNELEHIIRKLPTLDSQMDLLDLSGNTILDEGVFQLVEGLHKISKLNIQDCGISFKGTEALANKLGCLENKMDSLNLAGNQINDQGISALAVNLGKIKVLEVMMCSITGEGIHRLADGLKKLETPMELLDLSANSMEAPEKEALMNCQDKVKKVILLSCFNNKEKLGPMPDHFILEDDFSSDAERIRF